jgi:hypothetical protein
MPRRTPETLADYLVVAICPALIMLLVGSLMWFLVDVFYQGEYKARLLWVMAMFVIAVVGIARISMEEGHAYASLFAWPLAGAIALALTRLVGDGLLLGASIMLLVWWAAHKLTWDCTLIDDTQDASGQGLLQQMGLDPSAPPANQAPPGSSAPVAEPEATINSTPQPQRTWWETLIEPDRRPHAPGVWVVYFSLAALPLFGIGGWFVPSSDSVGRARDFGLLVIYVASGLGLLLATSFLGLRRYLRQRRLEMPLEMTSTWIIVGIVLIMATLLVATILPRPSREYSLSQLPFTVTSAVRRASRIAFGNEGTKDDSARNPATAEAQKSQTTDREGGQRAGQSEKSKSAAATKSAASKASGQTSEQGKASGESSQSQSSGASKGSQDGKSQSGKSQSGKSQNGKSGDPSPQSQAGEKSDGELQSQDSPQDNSRWPQEPNQSPDRKAGSSQAEESQPQSQRRWSASETISNVTSLAGKTFTTLIKLLFYGALLVALVVAAWIYRDELVAAWKKLLDELRELWAAWFGRKTSVEESAAELVAAPPRTFASFADPFATGDAGRMTWPQLVRYTFDALEAWGREQGCSRATGQTAHEYALAIAASEPHVAGNVQTLAAWYSQLAYAPRAESAGSPEPLRELWRKLRTEPT